MTAPPVGEIERLEALRLIEALIFASAGPVEEAAMAQRLPEGLALEPLLGMLREGYAGRGINLVRIGGGWTFRTAPDLAGRLHLEIPQPRRLTRAQLETLAIIAYHQPATRGDIEEIRGVALGKGTLDLLLETGWVQPRGRRESPGRPVTWVTTPAFLDHFGLDSLADLPSLEELKAAGLLDARPLPSRAEPADGSSDDAGPEEA